MRCGNNELLTVDCILSPIELKLVVTTDTNCGESSGSLTIEANGGNGSYQFSVNGGTLQSSGTFTNLVAADYTITVTDIGGQFALIMM